ncbi:MAG: PAS domain S-box protein [bacterium]|nr:PAS domain S-box protein [bacterium]
MDVLGRVNQISKTGQARFESVFYHAAIGIDIIDEAGRIVDCNPAFEKMFQYSRPELRAMTFVDLTHPDDIVLGRTLHQEIIAGKRAHFQIEKRYCRKDGSILWARLTVSQFDTDTSDEKLVIGMIEDITEQKRSESALRESEERFRRLSTAAFEGIFIHRGGVVLDANDQFAQLLGFSKGSDLIGQNCWHHVGRDARRRAIEQIRNRDEKPFEGIINNRDGQAIPVEVMGREIPWEGKTAGVVAIRNIQGRKEAEAAQRLMENQLFQADRMATIGTVASGIVHNLRNPLAQISGFADLLKMKHPEEKFISKILDSARQMNEMIENILVKGRRQLKQESIDLQQLLRRELEFLSTDQYFSRDIQIETSFGENVPPFWGAYTNLSQVFGNLLRNAGEAMFNRETKALRVSTYVRENQICVDIQDSGCGIPAADLERVFEAFFTTKVGDGKTAPQGTGLGLFMVRRLLTEDDAHIEVFSEEGVGTTFQVRLPIKAG